MIIVEEFLLKELRKIFKSNGILLLDDGNNLKPYAIYVNSSVEIEDRTKDFDRNRIEFRFDIWGDKNGSRIDLVRFKDKVVKILFNSIISCPIGCFIDSMGIDEISLYKELEGNSENKSNHYFRCVMDVNYKVRGI